MPKPDQKTPSVQPPAPPPPAPKPAPERRPGDCAAVTPGLRKAVDEKYGGKYSILSVGPTQIIIHDGNPKVPGQRVPKP